MLFFVYSALEVQVRNIVAYVFIFWVGCNTNSNDTSSNSSSCVQDYAGHAQCKEANGNMFFCGNEVRVSKPVVVKQKIAVYLERAGITGVSPLLALAMNVLSQRTMACVQQMNAQNSVIFVG